MPSSASPVVPSPAAPHEFWQDILPPATVDTAGPHSTFFPAELDDGRQICLPIRPLADGEHALASLIVNQASFE
ncbi:MAG: phosphoribosyltransferase, partial [Rhizobiales bacterium]|nr:phosphoribosyltransferase [Hyphomicrobiales bacterium]